MTGREMDGYGESVSDVYDSWYDPPGENALQLLTGLSGGGRVLELGIGSGRVALPLRRKGMDIRGIDISPSMLDRLREKPMGDAIPVTVGDFSRVDVEESFSLIFVVFNTFFALPDQETQVECFRNVAGHLQPGGRFLIEAFIPDLGRFTGGQSIRTVDIGDQQVRLDVSIHSSMEQRVVSNHLILGENGVRGIPVTIRYAWPSELDLMARLAGLRLEDRWQDWDRTSFSSASTKHISVYKLDERSTG